MSLAIHIPLCFKRDLFEIQIWLFPCLIVSVAWDCLQIKARHSTHHKTYETLRDQTPTLLYFSLLLSYLLLKVGENYLLGKIWEKHQACLTHAFLFWNPAYWLLSPLPDTVSSLFLQGWGLQVVQLSAFELVNTFNGVGEQHWVTLSDNSHKLILHSLTSVSISC